MRAIICDRCGKIVTANFGRTYVNYQHKDGWRITLKAGIKSDPTIPHDVCGFCVIDIIKDNCKEIKTNANR